METTIGVLGQRWRATVTATGTVEPWADDQGGDVRETAPSAIEWFIAADDRWHVPSVEPSVRQRRIDGTPVVETRVRIPQGDAVQRIYAVADLGGATVVEFENDSPMPIAVAVTGAGAMWTPRPSADVPIEGIDLPGPAVVLPIGHRSTVTVAIPHDRSARGGVGLPAGVPSATQVARGWLARAERAGRILVPDDDIVAGVVGVRCHLMLAGPEHPADDPIGFLLALDELVRCGERPHDWMPDLAEAVALLARRRDDVFVSAALDAARRVAVRADEPRAVRDLDRSRSRLVGPLVRSAGDHRTDLDRGIAVPSDVRSLVALERSFASDGELLSGGIPSDWYGQSFEVYGLPTGPASSVSYAVRWHGPRPAVLWEQSGSPIRLSAPVVDRSWSSDAATGEALWAAPVDAADPGGLGTVGTSFS